MNEQSQGTSSSGLLRKLLNGKTAIAAITLLTASALGCTAWFLSVNAERTAEKECPLTSGPETDGEYTETVESGMTPYYFGGAENGEEPMTDAETEAYPAESAWTTEMTESAISETETIPESETVPETARETEPAAVHETEPAVTHETEPAKTPETVSAKTPETEPVRTPETEEVHVPETAPAPETEAKPKPTKDGYTYVIFPEDVIPLSRKRQEYAIGIAKEYGFEVELLYAIMRVESHFLTDVVSSTNDYGIMQINKCNHDMMRRHLGLTDMFDYEQNVRAGAYMLSLCKKAHSNLSKMLMCYNRGIDEAEKAFAEGITSDKYSKKVLAAMQVYVDYKNAHLL